jgi:hypothetical protein
MDPKILNKKLSSLSFNQHSPSSFRTKPYFSNNEIDDGLPTNNIPFSGNQIKENKDNIIRNKRRSSSREELSVKSNQVRSKEQLKEIEFGWKDTETLNSVPPNDYTVTHINQNHELLVCLIKYFIFPN